MSNAQAREQQPVLVGVGQWLQHEDDLAQALGPVGAVEIAGRRAAESAGLPMTALADLDTVGLVDPLGWHPQNAPGLLAERFGARPTRTVQTALGGEMGCRLTNEIAGAIAAGRSRSALVVGVNLLRTAMRARAQEFDRDWPLGGEGEPERLGTLIPGTSEAEKTYGLALPVTIYPLLENALRAHRGLSPAEHDAAMGQLMSRFTQIAAENPYAWYPVERSPEELTTVTPENRMISYPYRKYLNSVLVTDQAAALLVLSAGEARKRGIPEEKWVYWRGGANAHEPVWHVSERPELHRSEGFSSAATGALDAAGVSLDEVGAFDFYSCFPVAVEVACDMLGLDEGDPRGFTVTGGLPYAGGPGNAYTIHSLAAMVERLRSGDVATGLVTGNGWYLTKHAATVLSREPAARVTEPAEIVSAPVDPLPVREEAQGSARVDGYTVVYDREGAPETGIVLGRLESGERFLSHTPEDRGLLEDFAANEQVGRSGRVDFDGERNCFHPE